MSDAKKEICHICGYEVLEDADGKICRVGHRLSKPSNSNSPKGE